MLGVLIMANTTATVSHRDYVYYGEPAFTFCYVEFEGFRADEMKAKLEEIETKLYDTSFLDKKLATVKDLRDKANTLRNQANSSKPFYRFWYNKTEKDLLSAADELSEQAYRLEKQSEELRLRKLSKPGRIAIIESLLNENGFVKKQTITNYDTSDVPYEKNIWTKED